MSSTNIGPTIGVNGVDQYKRDLDSAKAATKAFKAELDGAAKIKDPFASATASSTALGKEIAAQQIYIKGLTEKYGEAVQKHGAYSKQAYKAQEDLAKANKALSSMMQQYEKISTAKITIPGVGEFKRDIETLTQSTKTFKAEFQAITSGFGIEGAFKRASESSDKLKSSIEVQKETIKLLQEDYQKAVQEQGEFSQGAMEMREKIANATTELNNMEKTLRDLPNGFQTVGKEMIEYGNKWSAVGSEFTQAAKPFNAFTGAYGVAVGSAVKVSADYEQAMQKVAAVSGFTETEMQTLNQTLLDMTGESLYAPVELAQGLEVLGRAGIKDTNDQMTVLNAGLNLATAEGESFNTMADGLVNVLWMYGMGAEGAAEASDILAQASRSANTNVSYMFESLKYAGPMMSSLNWDLKDTALALDLMADNGVRGSQAGTGLRMAVANLVSPTEKQAAAMEKFGISLDDGAGNAVSFSNFLGQVRESFGGLDADLLTANGELKDADQLFEELSESLPTGELEKLQGVVDIFGKRALPGMLAMINASDERFDELNAAMENAGGTAQEMADIVGDSATGAWTRFKNEAMALGIEFGQTILPVVTEFLEKAKEWVAKFSEMDDGTKKFLLTAGGIIALIGPILSGIGGVASGIGTLISSGGHLMNGIGMLGNLIGLGAGGGGLIGAIGGLASSFGPLIAAAGPWIAIGAAIVAAGVLIYKNWDKIKETAAELKEWASQKWNELKENVSTTVENMKAAVTEKWNAIKQSASDTWNAIKQGITEKVNAIKQGVTDKVNALKTSVATAFDNIKSKITGAFSSAKEAAQNAFNRIKTLGDDIKSTISGIVESALNWGKDMIGNIASGIRQKISDVKNAITSVADTIRGYIHFTVPDKGPLADADTYMPDFMRLLASGVRNNMGLLRGASNDIASALMPDLYAELPEGGGGMTTNMGGVNIVINASPGMDVEDLAEAVEERISNLIVRREAAYA